jgi:hypothetical protein
MSGHVTVVPQCEEMEESMKGKHSPPSAGNIYAKANEVIVKITGDDTGQTFEVVEANRDFSRARITTSKRTRHFTFSTAAPFFRRR